METRWEGGLVRVENPCFLSVVNLFLLADLLPVEKLLPESKCYFFQS